jgi:hypothetical protein
MRDTITDPDFGTHARECHDMGWYVLDWDSDCLRPGTVTKTLTWSELLDIEVRQERTLDAAQ